MVPPRSISQEKELALGVGLRLRRLGSAVSGSRNMTAVRVPRQHREGDGAVDNPDDNPSGGDRGRGAAGAAVVPYSSPEAGFRGYTYEVGEALRDVRHQQREVKGGVAGPVQAVAELERAQEQRNEAFRLWLSGVMRRERELAKKAAFTVLKRRDQMLQEAGPDWFQQLSWDQMETANALEAAHRADSEESGTARLALWCARLGVFPVPSAGQLARALRRQPTDHEAFLLALYAVVSRSGKPPVPGDPPAPRLRTGFEFSPSERLLLSTLAHLRLPNIIGKLDEEFGPPEKHPRYLRISPDMPPPPARAERYLWPYLEPLPVPRMDWLELFSANHTAHLENLYMRAHKLPPALIAALRPKPLPRVTLPKQAAKPRVRFRKQKAGKGSAAEDRPAGVPPTEQGAATDAVDETPSRSSRTGRSASRTRSVGSSPVSPLRAPNPAGSADPAGPRAKRRAASKQADGEATSASAPGVDPASVVSFLESLADEEPLCRLPDVHRIPAIQKWVRLRNGLLYVHRRLAELLEDRSLVMWNANHLGMAYRVPTPKHGLTPRQVRELTWDRRDWYRRRVDKIMRGYNAALRTIQVNAAREMFPAMACDYFPSRDKFLRTYFAYMPKHQMDMVVVRPWNPGEYNQEILRAWRNRYYQCRGQK